MRPERIVSNVGIRAEVLKDCDTVDFPSAADIASVARSPVERGDGAQIPALTWGLPAAFSS